MALQASLDGGEVHIAEMAVLDDFPTDMPIGPQEVRNMEWHQNGLFGYISWEKPAPPTAGRESSIDEYTVWWSEEDSPDHDEDDEETVDASGELRAFAKGLDPGNLHFSVQASGSMLGPVATRKFFVRRTSDGKRDDKVALIVCAILGVASGIILLMSIARFIVIRCQRIRARYIIPVPEEPDESSRLITGSKARLRI